MRLLLFPGNASVILDIQITTICADFTKRSYVLTFVIRIIRPSGGSTNRHDRHVPSPRAPEVKGPTKIAEHFCVDWMFPKFSYVLAYPDVGLTCFNVFTYIIEVLLRSDHYLSSEGDVLAGFEIPLTPNPVH